MTTSEHLDITDLAEGQKNAATAVNSANQILDSAVQLWANDAIPSTTPPVSGVVNGSTFVVPAGATGDWSGKDTQVAVWQSGWTFLVPRRGWRCWDANRRRMTIFTGTIWEPFQAANQAVLGTMPVPTDFGEAAVNDQTLADAFDALRDAMILAGLMAGDVLTEVVDEAITIVEVNVEITELEIL